MLKILYETSEPKLVTLWHCETPLFLRTKTVDGTLGC